MKRPQLRSVPLVDVLSLGTMSMVVMTMSRDQWDSILAGAYEDGFVLLELDANENPVRAYQKAGPPEEVT